MHTTRLQSGRQVHHNGDYSGDVKIAFKPDEVEHIPAGFSPEYYEVTVDFEDLMELVSNYVRDRYISALEQSVPRDVLLNAVDPSKW